VSVEDRDQVDFVSLSEGRNTVKLTVSDHLDWSSPEEHLRLLQEKIYRYVDFVESGELWRAYPKAIGRKMIVIQIVLAHAPLPTAENFFRDIGDYISQFGMDLDVRRPGAS